MTEVNDPFTSHILNAGYQASQDFDAWVLKLGTAGMTLVIAIAGLVNTDRFTYLIVAGGLFSASLVAGLLSLRLSADGLRRKAEDKTLWVPDMWQFKWVRGLNWFAAGALSAAFAMLALFIWLDAIPQTENGR